MNTNKLLLLVVIMYLQTYNWFAQAQKPFLEPFFITDSISVNEWIEQKYGEDVQFYESARIKRRNNVVENTLIADTTKKYDLPTDLIIEHYIDSNNNDFFIEQYSWDRNRLYDCEGNILEEKEGYNVIELPEDAEEYKTIVNVSIGRFPNI